MTGLIEYPLSERPAHQRYLVPPRRGIIPNISPGSLGPSGRIGAKRSRTTTRFSNRTASSR
jgi:hypothetical protein